MGRIAAIAIAAVAAALLAPAVGAAATPGNLQLLQHSPRFTPVDIQTPGGAVRFRPGKFRIQVTPAGGAATIYTGFCVDLQHTIATGTNYPVSLETAADDAGLGTATARSVGWLIGNADSLIAAAADQNLEAGAIQLAIWELLGEASGPNSSADATLNARTQALKALSAGKSVAGPITVSVAPGVGSPGQTVQVTVTGAPGQTVALSASGPGALGAGQLVLDAQGNGTTTLTSTGVGVATVTASSQGFALTRATRAGSGTQQNVAFLVPQTFTAQGTAAFATSTLPSPPVTPSGTPRQPVNRSPANVRVTKTGPATATAGRTVTFTIRVRNIGGTAARNVRLRDLLPANYSLRSTAGLRLVGGTPTWTISRLAAGATRTYRVSVRIDADAHGLVCNRAVVDVGGSSARGARVCTRVSAVRRPVQPAVTG